MRLSRTGRAMRLIEDNGAPLVTSHAEGTTIRIIAKARRWWSILRAGDIDVTRLSPRRRT